MGETIAVMTFNLRFGLADDGKNSWANRQRAYKPFFKKHQPDFICFQEANSFQGDFLDNLLGEYDYIGRRDPCPEFWQDNLIFFKKSWRCLDNRRYYLSETPAMESKLPESKWPRQCTIGLFEKGGKKQILVNTHFDFKESVQRKSSELILEFLSEFPEGIPVVLTGDFNSEPYTPPYDTLISNGFNDVFKGEHTSTYHGFSGNELGGHIDWILYRGDMVACKRMVIRDQFAGIYPSDHFPVIAEFEFRKE